MNIEFINNAYTVDGLMLPMVHFESKEKNIGFIYEHNRGHSIENDIVMKDGSFKIC